MYINHLQNSVPELALDNHSPSTVQNRAKFSAIYPQSYFKARGVFPIFSKLIYGALHYLSVEEGQAKQKPPRKTPHRTPFPFLTSSRDLTEMSHDTSHNSCGHYDVS